MSAQRGARDDNVGTGLTLQVGLKAERSVHELAGFGGASPTRSDRTISPGSSLASAQEPATDVGKYLFSPTGANPLARQWVARRRSATLRRMPSGPSRAYYGRHHEGEM